MKVYGLIPARLQSTRLPRKLLLSETGKPLVQYVWEAAIQARELSEVIIAADDLEIANAVWQFGGRCELTGEHQSGTDRIAEVVRRCCPDGDIFVNIQGDEPELDPANIDAVVSALRNAPHAEMATLATPIRDREKLEAPSCVKVVADTSGRAMYFSRHPIPFSRDRDIDELLKSPDNPWLLHIGIYAYRREFLLKLSQMAPSRLEQLEKLEQLRALEAGAALQVGIVEHRSVGIDTPGDYTEFVKRQSMRDRTARLQSLRAA